MKIPRIANSVGYIDYDLITAAVNSKKARPWLKWGSVAACFAVLILAGAVALPSLLGSGRYKDYRVQSGETTVEWPWEYQTAYEKYTELTLNGTAYRSKFQAVSDHLIGSRLGMYAVSGYDVYKNEQRAEDFEVYRLKYAAERQFVAVRMDGAYYVFQNSKHTPPTTLGELFEAADLSSAIELSRFSENGGGQNDPYYGLNSDDFIWEVLAGCKNAAFTTDDKFSLYDGREYIGFTVTSETLGVYKKSLCVTEDGYLWTNAFEWGYLFNIGRDAAEQIIRYAKENSEEVPYEPYYNSVAGKIVEITEDYILLDDTVLCRNPLKGLRYKILLSDLRLSRYVTLGAIKEGDTVQVSFTGEINEADGFIISSAVSIEQAVISGGSLLIPE